MTTFGWIFELMILVGTLNNLKGMDVHVVTINYHPISCVGDGEMKTTIGSLQHPTSNKKMVKRSDIKQLIVVFVVIVS